MRSPLLVVRVLVSLALLAGFYALTLGIAAGLFVLPVKMLVSGHLRIGTGMIFLFAVCWIPAFLLLRGALLVRPPPFTPPGPELARDEAPELFALLDRLAVAARTA